MATYNEVLAIIRGALTLRPSGMKVKVSEHEAAEVALLNFIVSNSSGGGNDVSRSAHAVSQPEVNCELVWNLAFPDPHYAFTISGFTDQGDPVEIQLISQSGPKIIVQTMVGANLSAIANPY